MKENALPAVKENEAIECSSLNPEQHFTEPPARYSDATLVKSLEEYGIGRPSTYAPTIATIEDRNYVERDEKKRLKPTDVAFLVNDLLVEHFPRVVDYQFTADMEENLDAVAEGKKKWQPVIADFYFPFKENLEKKDKELNKKDITEEKTDEVCEKCGSPMVIKMGRYGKFLACSGYPECKNIKSLPGADRDKNGQADSEQVKAMQEKYAGEICEKCGSPMGVKVGRFGPFLGCTGYPKCKNIKNIEIKLNLKCPKCEKGEIVQKRSKRGKMFYACNQYPNCDFALWDKPTGEKCQKCGSLLVFGSKGANKCSNKECKQE
jgi:DNA topoisomerase-1